MRVLDTLTGQFVDIDPTKTKYAILSHTWNPEGEQTYQELREIQQCYVPKRRPRHGPPDPLAEPHQDRTFSHPQIVPRQSSFTPIWDDLELSPKILEACRVAREIGYRYLWIDSCCINKESSSELSESLNSMYQWYAHADVCYAFLPDVSAKEDHQEIQSRFRCSRWFRRGWTLQELIAPRNVQFLSMQWTPLGSKESLAELIAEITNIQYNALLHIEPLDEFSVAQRLSWAADRETTRVEDRAYSLLGIFDINMPTLYGEGQRAFRRLQEEIMRRTTDQSLFAWTSPRRARDPWPQVPNPNSTDAHGPNTTVTLSDSEMPFLAPSPDYFKYCKDIKALSHDEVARRLQVIPKFIPTIEYDFTPHGIRTQLPVISITNYFSSSVHIDSAWMDVSRWYLIILGCGHNGFPRCLLGRVCCLRSSGSGVEFLHGRFINLGGIDGFDLLPLSPMNITRLHSLQISVKTLYIPQPATLQRASDGVKDRGQRHKTIKFVLAEKTLTALSSQGYTTTLLRKPHDFHPHTHTVTLEHATHTITIDYRYTLKDVQVKRLFLNMSAQELIIEANVKTSVPTLAPQHSDQVDDDPGTLVSWKEETALSWDEEFPSKQVVLECPGEPKPLTVCLGLSLVTTNYYFLSIKTKMADS